jgi:hypothetical protein
MLALLAVSYGVYGQGLDEEEKEEILNAHNHYRGQVDPVATNMLKMEWNEDLAYLAQFWASGCAYMENEDRNTQSTSFDYVGESLAATVSYTVNYTQLIGQLWYGEKRYFNYYAAACIDEDGNQDEDGEFETCGRYTQMVWARTYAVGCGAFRCAELEGAEDANENALFLVCYYGPGGNFANEPPYSTGSAPCDACPYTHEYCVNNLCSESGAPMVVPTSILGLLVTAFAVFSSHL